MAHKKGVGSSRNGRDSNPKYRGIKKFGGERVVAGNIILRQCGTKWHPGKNVGLGTDYTIYSLIDGVVKFEHKSKTRLKVSVYPETQEETTSRPDLRGSTCFESALRTAEGAFRCAQTVPARNFHCWRAYGDSYSTEETMAIWNTLKGELDKAGRAAQGALDEGQAAPRAAPGQAAGGSGGGVARIRGLPGTCGRRRARDRALLGAGGQPRKRRGGDRADRARDRGEGRHHWANRHRSPYRRHRRADSGSLSPAT